MGEKAMKKELDKTKRIQLMKEYKRMYNRERQLSLKKRNMKQRMEADQIEMLSKDYDGIAWDWLKDLIPKRKKIKQELDEVIDQNGNIKGKEEESKGWRETYETLGRETEEEEGNFDNEYNEKIIKELKLIEYEEIRSKVKEKK